MRKEYFSMEEIAELLGVHISTVRRWIREGRLPAINVCTSKRSRWRVSQAALDEFLEENSSKNFATLCHDSEQ